MIVKKMDGDVARLLVVRCTRKAGLTPVDYSFEHPDRTCVQCSDPSLRILGSKLDITRGRVCATCINVLSFFKKTSFFMSTKCYLFVRTPPERCKRGSDIRKIHSFPALTIIIIRRSLENAGLRSGYPERHLRIFQAESEQLFRPISNLSCVKKKGPWCFAYWGRVGSYFTANGEALILQLNAPEF